MDYISSNHYLWIQLVAPGGLFIHQFLRGRLRLIDSWQAQSMLIFQRTGSHIFSHNKTRPHNSDPLTRITLLLQLLGSKPWILSLFLQDTKLINGSSIHRGRPRRHQTFLPEDPASFRYVTLRTPLICLFTVPDPSLCS